jgi:hypothetical protein
MKHLDGHVWGDRYWSKILEGEPLEEEIAAGEDCAGSDGEGNAACEVAEGEIPKARLERGPPDGDGHREEEAARNAHLTPLSPVTLPSEPASGGKTPRLTAKSQF